MDLTLRDPGRSRSECPHSAYATSEQPILTCRSFHLRRDYHLPGSYRKILHLPGDLSWQRIPYTDPDVSLAQSDEDKILERDPPPSATDAPSDARFLALQVKLKIGTAAYATMALREVTKTETSSAFQTQLTAKSADQAFRGTEAKEGEAAAAAVAPTVAAVKTEVKTQEAA